ncbi:TadE/TadG family type IV pilus assembly protein [Nocardioides terrisoli]|uniref:TadE/TadG family type IV pilus assembly protein n=1 Tax=Nocardioides terrisoli TaxID=3388267 RepID=UPI00287BBDCB|nr:TadE/TadG family type IV pilus assembly protein [Nocardioides marmorisolisilvae]
MPMRTPTMRHHTARDQSGAVAIEFMLVIGMLILVLLLMLQYALRSYAQHIATAAAEQGLAAASAYDGSASRARAVTRDYLTHLGPGIDNTGVSVTRSPDRASITITGRTQEFIPFLPVRVRVHLEGPVEHFVPAAQPQGGQP